MIARSAALLWMVLAAPLGAAAQPSSDLRVPDIFRDDAPEAPRPGADARDDAPRDLVVPEIFRAERSERGAIPPELRVPDGFAPGGGEGARAHAELRVPEIFRGPGSPAASDLRYPADWPRAAVPSTPPERPRPGVPSELRVPEAFGGGSDTETSELRVPEAWSARAIAARHVAREVLADPRAATPRPRDELASPR